MKPKPPPGPWRPNPTIAEAPCRHPRPGPLDWDWRCLNCGWAVNRHRPWWRRLLHIDGSEGGIVDRSSGETTNNG